jgi:hypothetical protein
LREYGVGGYSSTRARCRECSERNRNCDY